MGDAGHVELLEPLLLESRAEFRPEPEPSFLQPDFDLCASCNNNNNNSNRNYYYCYCYDDDDDQDHDHDDDSCFQSSLLPTWLLLLIIGTTL